jgi:hypothetical protein
MCRPVSRCYCLLLYMGRHTALKSRHLCAIIHRNTSISFAPMPNSSHVPYRPNRCAYNAWNTVVTTGNLHPDSSPHALQFSVGTRKANRARATLSNCKPRAYLQSRHIYSPITGKTHEIGLRQQQQQQCSLTGCSRLGTVLK